MISRVSERQADENGYLLLQLTFSCQGNINKNGSDSGRILPPVSRQKTPQLHQKRQERNRTKFTVVFSVSAFSRFSLFPFLFLRRDFTKSPIRQQKYIKERVWHLLPSNYLLPLLKWQILCRGSCPNGTIKKLCCLRWRLHYWCGRTSCSLCLLFSHCLPLSRLSLSLCLSWVPLCVCACVCVYNVPLSSRPFVSWNTLLRVTEKDCDCFLSVIIDRSGKRLQEVKCLFAASFCQSHSAAAKDKSCAERKSFLVHTIEFDVSWPFCAVYIQDVFLFFSWRKLQISPRTALFPPQSCLGHDACETTQAPAELRWYFSIQKTYKCIISALKCSRQMNTTLMNLISWRDQLNIALKGFPLR